MYCVSICAHIFVPEDLFQQFQIFLLVHSLNAITETVLYAYHTNDGP